ncbi:Protein OPAQUE1 [Camellia lanceoleosa]|uniref:Protein OPAQUE1 n=1 Tax=Camellia lanceoleosa TaxID=1840588 RepID=A0ACC0IYY7_9ERIC|nr:Protein OPAQUE1 [Camellia lanceoleosa]
MMINLRSFQSSACTPLRYLVSVLEQELIKAKDDTNDTMKKFREVDKTCSQLQQNLEKRCFVNTSLEEKLWNLEDENHVLRQKALSSPKAVVWFCQAIFGAIPSVRKWKKKKKKKKSTNEKKKKENSSSTLYRMVWLTLYLESGNYGFVISSSFLMKQKYSATLAFPYADQKPVSESPISTKLIAPLAQGLSDSHRTKLTTERQQTWYYLKVMGIDKLRS